MEPVFLAVGEEGVDVETIFIGYGSVVLGDADDGVALFEEDLCGVRAYVAEALDDDAAAFYREVESLEGLVADDGDSASGGLAAAT